MINLVILIPVLRRPQNIKPLVESVEATTKDFELLFIASPGDDEEIAELENQNQSYGIMNASYENNGDYARKINAGFYDTKAEWYFLGADDLRFYPGWFDHAMVTYKKTGACVIGTSDLGNPLVKKGLHSTHSLVLGEYATECGTIDEPGKILHEGYRHNFCDTELVGTAKCREAWAFSSDSKVQHLHPDWKLAPMDEVYKLGKSGWEIDRRYFELRKKLWL